MELSIWTLPSLAEFPEDSHLFAVASNCSCANSFLLFLLVTFLSQWLYIFRFRYTMLPSREKSHAWLHQEYLMKLQLKLLQLLLLQQLHYLLSGPVDKVMNGESQWKPTCLNPIISNYLVFIVELWTHGVESSAVIKSSRIRYLSLNQTVGFFCK